MNTTVLEIPTELLEAAGITPQEAKAELAIRLYQLQRLNGRQAAELAGEPKVIASLDWSRNEAGHFDLDDFLSWASHDLKTPLNSIIGFSSVILKGLSGPISETQETDLSTVLRAGQRMLALVGYLVEIARLNNGHTQLSPEDANIEEVITEATKRWTRQNEAKPLHMEMTLADPIFNVDKGQMRQIVSHLLTLASLHVTEGTVSLFASDSEDALNVRVQSRGTKSANRFEMDSTMLRFIVSSLVKLHGGQMDDPQETEDGLLSRFSVPR
ncbi:HAMP domain-containing histidine kinase [Chloroflexi bacterium CFX6]|nr:HAMP domain-containing histidine kinase [Chloroflexi bacterium CFX6]